MTTRGEMVLHTTITDGNTCAAGDFDSDDARHEDTGLSDEVSTGFKYADCVTQSLVL